MSPISHRRSLFSLLLAGLAFVATGCFTPSWYPGGYGRGYGYGYGVGGCAYGCGYGDGYYDRRPYYDNNRYYQYGNGRGHHDHDDDDNDHHGRYEPYRGPSNGPSNGPPGPLPAYRGPSNGPPGETRRPRQLTREEREERARATLDSAVQHRSGGAEWGGRNR
jgi:hypothetical protein